MKKVFVLVVGLLLIGVNIYAAGDLVVNGKIGIGITPTYSLHVAGGQTRLERTDGAVLAGATLRSDITGAGTTKTSNTFTTDIADADWSNYDILGFNASVNYTGRSSGGSGIYSFQNTALFNSTVPGAHSLAKVYNAFFKLAIGGVNTQNIAIDEYVGFKHSYEDLGAGSLTGTNWYSAYFTNPPAALTPTNLHGIWIEKQTSGTNNFGIVLAGDGAGADVVFGTGNNVKLYANAGDLYVKDAANNVTLLGPHDPATGEWIFYSQNIKTGKTVRVNMEKLVKAVEKLTGETFMVETLVEGN
ncbi:MAG: hypothetical protein HZC49_03775 [Nitrospirae bacterium]|nr:hypothetical protein [Nitrospirota bacterium]